VHHYFFKALQCESFFYGRGSNYVRLAS
jgi:hypothetical protein